MNIASFNSYSNQNLSQFKNNKSKANVNFGIKFHPCCDRLINALDQEAQQSIRYNVRRLFGLETPIDKLRARMKELERHRDNLSCIIRPGEFQDDGIFYLDANSPIVDLYHEGEAQVEALPLAGPCHNITNAYEEALGLGFAGPYAGIKKLLRFFNQDADSLTKTAENTIARIKIENSKKSQ